jgi:hypothetical protein
MLEIPLEPQLFRDRAAPTRFPRSVLGLTGADRIDVCLALRWRNSTHFKRVRLTIFI